MINATMCYLNVDGRTLFLYRNLGEKDIHNGMYVPPGGRTERNERGIDCVVREFREETGLRLINPKLRAIATFYNEGRLMGGKKDPEDWLVEVYQASEFMGDLREEHPQAKPIWVPDAALKGLRMHPGDRAIMKRIKRDGVHQILMQYDKKKLIRFEARRVD